MRTAVFPGSFDPPTLGHMDLIERSRSVCDKLYVAVSRNSEKVTPAFDERERVQMLEKMTSSMDHVEVMLFDGLIVDLCKRLDAQFLLRGIRAFSDLENEYRMACANRRLTGIDTVFLMTADGHAHISSTLIKEIGRCGGSLEEFVPAEILTGVCQRLDLSSKSDEG